MTKDELLKACTTREILAEMKRQRASYSEEVTLYNLSRMITGGIQATHEYYHEELKAELALRPHVPNKRESRGLRLQKIRAGV